METLCERVSTVDAKNSLPRLLQEVETGRSTIIITRRGKPIARLVPYADDKKQPNKEDILKQFDEIRNNIKGEVDIKAYIAEGRNLASFDKKLIEAAKKAGVKTFR